MYTFNIYLMYNMCTIYMLYVCPGWSECYIYMPWHTTYAFNIFSVQYIYYIYARYDQNDISIYAMYAVNIYLMYNTYILYIR